MRVSKALVCAVAVAVVAGAVAFAATAGVQLSSPDHAVQAPVGRVGDEVAYDVLTKESLGGPWLNGGRFSLRANGTVRTIDEFGEPHEALEVLWNFSATPKNKYFNGLYFGQSETRPVRTLLDLTTRDVLRHDMVEFEPDYVALYSDFGPRLDHALFRFSGGSVDPALLLRSQAQRFAVGEDLTAADEPRFANEWGLPEVGELISYRSEVGPKAAIGGEASIGVRITGALRFSPTSVPWGAKEGPWIDGNGDGRTPFLSFSVPIGPTIEFQRTIWISSTFAYPLLIEDRIKTASEGIRVATWARVAEAPGSIEIPWGLDSSTHQYRDFNEAMERGPSQIGHPVDGQDSEIPSLEAALRWADTAPMASGLRTWRAAHPSSRLVGIDCCRDGAYALLFGTQEGRAYSIHASDEVDPNLMPPGEFRLISPFKESDLRSNLVTWAASVELAESLRPSRDDWWPWFADWGYYFHYFAANAARPMNQKPFTYGNATDLRYLMVGSETENATHWQGFWLQLNAETGKIEHIVQELVVYDNDWKPPEALTHAQRMPSPPVAAPLAPAGRGPPAVSPVEAAAITASTLLAVLLAAYFYPLVKYAGVQAAAFLPGYAKLRRAALLNHRVREDLISHINSDPGTSPPELAKRVGAAFSTVVYHLRVLEHNRLVSSLIDGRHRRFFPVESIDWSKRGQLAALYNQKTRAVFDLIQEDPGIRPHVLAKRMGFTTPGMLWHLRRLESCGLVAHEKVNRGVHYYPKENAHLSTAGPASPGVEIA